MFLQLLKLLLIIEATKEASDPVRTDVRYPEVCFWQFSCGGKGEMRVCAINLIHRKRDAKKNLGDGKSITRYVVELVIP